MGRIRKGAVSRCVCAAGVRSVFAALTTLASLFAILPVNRIVAADSQRPVKQKPSKRGSAIRSRPRDFVANPTSQKILDEVAGRLLGVSRNHPGTNKYVWPPRITLEDMNTINAFADIDRDRGSGVPIPDKASGKFVPLAVVTQQFMDEVAQNDPDRLALVLGHELSHLLLGHVLPTSPSSRARTNTLFTVFRAEEEHEADILGMKLALEANYSIRGAREVWIRVKDPEFLRQHREWRDYTSFEGVGVDHPSWSDRLALIDTEKESLWKAMSAFENGVYFLTFQKYAEAESAFKYVVDDTGCNELVDGKKNCRGFPNSFDAWSNLGYALLMQYCDKLDQGDMARYNVGQLVTGSFYIRPPSLTPQVKGVDARLWNSAVNALKKALELNPNATLARANLGLAYLLSPLGKNVPEATKHLEQAAQSGPGDQTLTEENRAAVLINSAVALTAAGEGDKAKTRLDNAEEVLTNDEMYVALKYDRALLLSQSADADKKSRAAALLTDYLRQERPSSLWWILAYDLYKKLVIQSGQTPLPAKTFADASSGKRKLRPITSVDLGAGVLIKLSDPLSMLPEKVRAVKPVPVLNGTNLVRLFYNERGLEILATRRVIAIFLRGDNAPTLKVQHMGTGESSALLRIGMTMRELQTIINETPVPVPLTDPNVKYGFYPGLGVAVLYDGKNRIQEMVITQPAIDDE